MKQAKELASLLLALAMVLTMTVGFSACGTKTVQLADYITIDVDGYSGKGTATYDIDYSALAMNSDLSEKLYKLSKKSGYGNTVYGFDLSDSPESQVSHYLSLIDAEAEFENNGGIQNGDTVTLDLSCNKTQLEQLSKALGVKIEANGTATYTVGEDELPLAQEINPFDFVKINFTGAEGSAILKFKVSESEKTYGDYTVKGSDSDNNITVTKGDESKSYTFYIDSIGGNEDFDELKRTEGDLYLYKAYNNQKAVFSVDEPDEDEGYFFTNIEKTVTIKDLTPVVTDASKLTAKQIDGLMSDTVQQLKEQTFGQFLADGKKTVKLLVSNSSESPTKNRLLVRIEGTYKEVRVNDGGYPGFMYCEFTDVYLKDGKLKYSAKTAEKVYFDNGDDNQDGKEAWKDITKQEFYTTNDVKLL